MNKLSISIIEDYCYSQQQIKSSVESLHNYLDKKEKASNINFKILQYTIKIFNDRKWDFFNEEIHQQLIKKTKCTHGIKINFYHIRNSDTASSFIAKMKILESDETREQRNKAQVIVANKNIAPIEDSEDPPQTP